MARYMADSASDLWRAVFTFDRGSHGVVRTFYGPYERKQDAAGMLTRMGRYHRNPLEKYIEKTPVNWEPVE